MLTVDSQLFKVWIIVGGLTAQHPVSSRQPEETNPHTLSLLFHKIFISASSLLASIFLSPHRSLFSDPCCCLRNDLVTFLAELSFFWTCANPYFHGKPPRPPRGWTSLSSPVITDNKPLWKLTNIDISIRNLNTSNDGISGVYYHPQPATSRSLPPPPLPKIEK